MARTAAAVLGGDSRLSEGMGGAHPRSGHVRRGARTPRHLGRPTAGCRAWSSIRDQPELCPSLPAAPAPRWRAEPRRDDPALPRSRHRRAPASGHGWSASGRGRAGTRRAASPAPTGLAAAGPAGAGRRHSAAAPGARGRARRGLPSGPASRGAAWACLGGRAAGSHPAHRQGLHGGLPNLVLDFGWATRSTCRQAPPCSAIELPWP